MRPGGADTPPEAPTSAAYQATEETVLPVAGGEVLPPSTVVALFAPVDLDQRARDVLAVISMEATHEGRARIPEREIARRLGWSRHRVRTAKIRAERHGCLVVIPGSVQADGRLPTATFQITVGPWAHLWTPPTPVRERVHQTFDRRAEAMPDRRAELDESQKRAQERALVISEARPGDPNQRAQERAQEARPRSTCSTSRGSALLGAPPPTDAEYEEKERLYRELCGEDLGAPLPPPPDPRPFPIGANDERTKQHLAEARDQLAKARARQAKDW